MLHRIITVLTTAAIALHALLGCCAHHAHACDSQPPRQVLAPATETVSCCALSHPHTERAIGDGESIANNGSQEQEESSHSRCDQGDCSFAPAPRCSGAESVIAASQCYQALGEVARATVSLPCYRCTGHAKYLPQPLVASGSARALTQVWRL